MKKTVGMALASLLAVLVLSGQALGHRSMLSLEEDTASAFDSFTDYREEIASTLDLRVNQVGYIGINLYSDGLVNIFQLLPESYSFETSEVNRIHDILVDGDLGTLSDFSYDDYNPEALKVTITTSDDDGYYNDLLQYRKEAASVLGLNFDQIGEVDLVVKPDTVVFTLELLPEYSSFDEKDFNSITNALQTGDLGPLYDLEYSNDTPGALSATIWSSSTPDDNYDGVENYFYSYMEDEEGDKISTGARKLLSDPFYDDDLYYYVEYDIYYYFD